MGRRLRILKVDDDLFMSEKACENYVCCSCGKKMISVNFVTGICIQVFVTHGEDCKCFKGNAFRRTVEVTCETCRYYDKAENHCRYEGNQNSRIESVRTAG